MVYFFYFDIWVDKLNETIKMVKLRYHIIFDIENFRFIDIDIKKVVRQIDSNYYLDILKKKAEDHFNKKHYETSRNLYKQINYLFETEDVSLKIRQCFETIKKEDKN